MMAADPTAGHDTVLVVPESAGGVALVVQLNLMQPPVADLRAFRTAPYLDALRGAVGAVPAVYARPAQHVAHALEHVSSGEFDHAWPSLVIGVEGLFWAAAEQLGVLAANGTVATTNGRRRHARSANDVIAACPISATVRTMLARDAFGSTANALRHGRGGNHDVARQCDLWLLALCAWFDWTAR
jgi:hypothetical protein